MSLTALTHRGAVTLAARHPPGPGGTPPDVRPSPPSSPRYSGAMTLPILIVGDVQGDHERLAGALVAYPEERFETIFLGDFFTGGRPGDAGGHRAARMAMSRRNSRAILGNHDLLVMALVEEGRYGGERLRAVMASCWRPSGGGVGATPPTSRASAAIPSWRPGCATSR